MLGTLQGRPRPPTPEEATLTYTVLAVHPTARLIGAATASCSVAVGRSVISVIPDVGAVASQAYTNRLLRAHGVAELRAGRDPADIAELVAAWDPRAGYRQFGVIDVDGRIGAFTGGHCTDAKGSREGDGVLALGNHLERVEVLDAMIDAFERGLARVEASELPHLEFARVLVEALAAGDELGGDSRGRQSAAVQVAKNVDAPKPRDFVVAPSDASLAWPPELVVDLRVDDARDPIAELARLHTLAVSAEIAIDPMSWPGPELGPVMPVDAA